MPSRTRTCPRGHQWELPSSPEALGPGSPLTCPVCGAGVKGAAEGSLPETIPLSSSIGALADAEVAAGSRGTPTLTAPGVQIRCPHCHSPLHLGDERSDEVL